MSPPNDVNQFGDVFLILLYIFLECGHRLCNGLNVAGGGSDGVSHSLHGGLHLLHLEDGLYPGLVPGCNREGTGERSAVHRSIATILGWCNPQGRIDYPWEKQECFT